MSASPEFLQFFGEVDRTLLERRVETPHFLVTLETLRFVITILRKTLTAGKKKGRGSHRGGSRGGPGGGHSRDADAVHPVFSEIANDVLFKDLGMAADHFYQLKITELAMLYKAYSAFFANFSKGALSVEKAQRQRHGLVQALGREFANTILFIKYLEDRLDYRLRQEHSELDVLNLFGFFCELGVFLCGVFTSYDDLIIAFNKGSDAVNPRLGLTQGEVEMLQGLNDAALSCSGAFQVFLKMGDEWGF